MLLILADVAYFAVIALHVYFVVLEMVLWKKLAPKVFRVSPAFAEQSAGLASNQGLYNGFLVVALLIGYFAPIVDVNIWFMIFGLGCVIVAGIWGGITVNKRIFFVQAVPAIVALGLRLLLLI